VANAADLAVTKSGPATINAGSNITYTIGVTNNGPVSAVSVALADTLPAGTTFVSLTSPGGWTCTTPAVGGTGPVACTIATLASGASGTFTLVVKVGAGVANGTTITNTATASSTTTDPTPGNNSQSSSTTVGTSADLAVTKSGAATATVGNNVAYNVTVTNNGPGDAQSVALSDPVPANTTFVSVTAPAGWSCTAPAVGGTGTIACTIATLASGSAATFNVVFAVSTSAAGTTITNTASVSASTGDPTPANNAASATTAVSAVTTFSGPSATGSGTITASFVGGGPGCTFSSPQFIGAPPGAPPIPPTTPGPGIVFAHGLFTFSTTGCISGSTLTFTITYPGSIVGATYWKYGPTPTNSAPHWYGLPAAIAGSTATFSITDGGLGDDDLVANGTITDQGGPGTGGSGATAIPTLSEWMLIVLALAMMVLAMRHRATWRG
jgi:uncharacterized repeat protein (TIGR01451 family)